MAQASEKPALRSSGPPPGTCRRLPRHPARPAPSLETAASGPGGESKGPPLWLPKRQSLPVLCCAGELPLRTRFPGSLPSGRGGGTDPFPGCARCLHPNPGLQECRCVPAPRRLGHPPPVTSLDTSMVPSSLMRCSSSSKTSSSSGWMYLLRGGWGSRLCWNTGVRGGLGARALQGLGATSVRGPQGAAPHGQRPGPKSWVSGKRPVGVPRDIFWRRHLPAAASPPR